MVCTYIKDIMLGIHPKETKEYAQTCVQMFITAPK